MKDKSTIVKEGVLFIDILKGFAKFMLILVVHFITTVVVPARITDYSLYNPEGIIHYNIGFPFNSITIIADGQNLNNWNLLFDGNIGVGVNMIQFLLNLFLTYVIITLLFRWIERKRSQRT